VQVAGEELKIPKVVDVEMHDYAYIIETHLENMGNKKCLNWQMKKCLIV
jgi:hypothetical protein